MTFVEDFVVGRTVDFREIDACLNELGDRWRVSCHVQPSGEVGWYRRLSVADRIGFVATANAISALRISDDVVPHAQEVVKTLLGRRREDGAWPYVSNLNDVGVVDATAAVLLALYEWQDAVDFRAQNLREVLQNALDWLERAALDDGGWGLICGAPYRNYSTAIAVEALCHCERRSSPVVQRAIHRLLSEADPRTGAWHDAGRALSIPTTCEVVRALSAAASDHSKYNAEIAKACDWILQSGRQTQLWEAGPATACSEEIEVTVGTRLVRVECGHSTRPVAIGALSVGGRAHSTEVVAAVRALLDDVAANRWERTAGGRGVEPTSWMLYDAAFALDAFRNAFSRDTVAVWADKGRVVEHRRGQGWLARAVSRHKPKLLIGAACLVVVWLISSSGMVPVGVSMVGFVISTIVLGVVSNLAFELVKKR